ncbi:cytochrome c oxidase subunit II [Limibacillus sp. MBR-115]|uniref:cytochrome c oxidase subunit II n=1 Tax=Limibacillus sp. MBR-115 TaxID=3156465 RepID=UPI00339389CD
MSKSARWNLGGCMGLASLLGLFLASRAGSGIFYWIGLIVFLAGVLVVFNLIRAAFDESEGLVRERPNYVAHMLIGVALGTVAFHIFSPWWWAPIASNWQYIDDTINLTFLLTGAVFVIILLFMAYCVVRYSHKKGNRAEYEPESKKLEVILTVLTTVAVAAMLAPGLFVWNQFVEPPAEATEIEVIGQQWNWSYRLPGEDGQLGTSNIKHIGPDNPLGINPDDPNGQDDIVVQGGALHLPLDKPVKVLMRSIDVLHSFYVPEFRTKMDMVPGMVTFLWLTPSRTGTFQVLCAELCGVAHALMRGEVVVDEEAEYLAWLQEQKTFAQLAAAARESRISSLTQNQGEAKP